MGILERIKEIEQEMDKTQRNKATEGHLGMLKARLAKLRSELLTPSSGGGGGQVCRVSRDGISRVQPLARFVVVKPQWVEPKPLASTEYSFLLSAPRRDNCDPPLRKGS